MTRLIPAQSPGPAKARQVPRAPLPATGVTSCAVASCTTSESITPPSSLILAHAPDQIPPADFGCPYYDGSLQVVASPCWELALPDIISAILAWVPGPLPRSVLLVLLLASSQKTTASPQTSQVRHTKITPAMQLQQGTNSRGCSHSVMFRLPRSLGPQVAPTAEALSPQSGRAVYTTHSSVDYFPRDVVSLRIRHKQLIRLDFHQLDCSLVGCSDAL